MERDVGSGLVVEPGALRAPFSSHPGVGAEGGVRRGQYTQSASVLDSVVTSWLWLTQLIEELPNITRMPLVAVFSNTSSPASVKTSSVSSQEFRVTPSRAVPKSMR